MDHMRKLWHEIDFVPRDYELKIDDLEEYEVDAKDADLGLDLAISDLSDSRASSDVESLSLAGVPGLEL